MPSNSVIRSSINLSCRRGFCDHPLPRNVASGGAGRALYASGRPTCSHRRFNRRTSVPRFIRAPGRWEQDNSAFLRYTSNAGVLPHTRMKVIEQKKVPCPPVGRLVPRRLDAKFLFTTLLKICASAHGVPHRRYERPIHLMRRVVFQSNPNYSASHRLAPHLRL